MYLLWVGVSDICIDAVCHISELRPEALQLNCVHSLDENPVYIPKEVYFVSPFPPIPSCCIFHCEIFPAARSVCPHCLIYPRMHLQMWIDWSEHLVPLVND